MYNTHRSFNWKMEKICYILFIMRSILIYRRETQKLENKKSVKYLVSEKKNLPFKNPLSDNDADFPIS